MLRYLKFAAYLNFAAAAIYLLANLHFPFAFLLGSAVFFLDGIERGKRYFKPKKIIILIIALISIIFNPISAILTFLAYSKIDEKESKVKKNWLEKLNEKEQINLMIKMGAGLILFGALVFAATIWEFMPNYWKLILLLLMATIFFLLSNFNEKKLKIKESTILYWNLGIVFVILSFVVAGYYSLFGNVFSFFGEGNHLLQLIIFIILAAFANISYYMFKEIEYKFILFLSGLLIINSLLAFIGMDLTFRFIILILSTITFALFNNKADYYNKFTEFAAIFIFPGSFLLFAIQLGNNLAYIAYMILTIGFMLFYTKKKSEESYLNFFTPFVTLIIVSLGIAIFPYYNWQFFPYILTSLLTLAYFIVLLLPVKDILKKYFLLIINVGYAFVIFDMITNVSFTHDYDVRLKLGIVTMILVSNIFSFLFKQKNILLLEKLLQPLKIIAFVTVGYIYLLTFNWYDDLSYLGHLLYVVMLVMLIFTKNELSRRIYYFWFYGIFLVMLIDSIFFEPIVPIVLLVAAGTAFLYTFKVNDQFKDKLLFTTYLIFIVTAYLQIIVNDAISIGLTMSAFITLFLFTSLMIALRNHNSYFIVTALATLMPVHTIIIVNAPNIELYLILSSMLYFYGLYLLNQFIFVEKNSRLILTPLLAAFIILTVIFTPKIIIGAYMFLIGLLLIVFGFKREDYNPLFYLGVGTIVITILYQLRIFWPIIPVWIYLLFTGGLLVIYATFLELKKLNK